MFVFSFQSIRYDHYITKLIINQASGKYPQVVMCTSSSIPHLDVTKQLISVSAGFIRWLFHLTSNTHILWEHEDIGRKASPPNTLEWVPETRTLCHMFMAVWHATDYNLNHLYRSAARLERWKLNLDSENSKFTFNGDFINESYHKTRTYMGSRHSL
jgi:hypothetical protein